MADDDYLWDPAARPDPEVQRLEQLLRPAAHVPAPLRLPDRAAPHHPRSVRWATAAAVLAMVGGGAWALRGPALDPWTVDVERGTPAVRTADGTVTTGRLARGGVIETDARSSATLAVGRIGRARLEPGSRLRLLGNGTSEHRLALDRGTMHASIDAPPRYFLVETASALAVDLGCVYTLTADEAGNGMLTVEEGEVELQMGGTRSSVLAGNSASLRTGRGPGLPFPVKGSAALRRAVAAYDATPTSAAVDAVLAASDAGSTITLWHLLQRATPLERERVFAQLSAVAPPPATVTRDRVLRGESGALQRWRTDLEPSWIHEAPLWRRMWLALAR